MVSDASCFHDVIVNGPSLTLWPGWVHLSPHFVTASLFTGMNDVCESCCMNHGCGDVSWIFRVVASGALIATLSFSELHCWLAALGLQLLYSCAPLML